MVWLNSDFFSCLTFLKLVDLHDRRNSNQSGTFRTSLWFTISNNVSARHDKQRSMLDFISLSLDGGTKKRFSSLYIEFFAKKYSLSLNISTQGETKNFGVSPPQKQGNVS